MAKAEKGSTSQIHEYVHELVGDDLQDDGDNMYTILKDMGENDVDPAFMFGKCVFKNIGNMLNNILYNL